MTRDAGAFDMERWVEEGRLAYDNGGGAAVDPRLGWLADRLSYGSDGYPDGFAVDDQDQEEAFEQQYRGVFNTLFEDQAAFEGDGLLSSHVRNHPDKFYMIVGMADASRAHHT